jgi:hypothetical protein
METGKLTPRDKTSILKSATDALELVVKYRSSIESRLKPGEIEMFEDAVHEFSGKKEPYKRVRTRTREETADELYGCLRTILNLVKNNNPSGEIMKAYSIQDVTPDHIQEIIEAGRKIIRAFSTYKDWSMNEAGILMEDMDEINDMILELSGKAEPSGNIRLRDEELSAGVIKEIRRISALGVHVYKKKDPAVAAIFEKLIPSGSEHEMAEAEVTG